MRPWDAITEQMEAKESSAWNDYGAFRSWYEALAEKHDAPSIDEIDDLPDRVNERGFHMSANIGLYCAMCEVFDNYDPADLSEAGREREEVPPEGKGCCAIKWGDK